jgi:hypothetical protein
MQTIECRQAETATIYHGTLFAWAKQEVRDLKAYVDQHDRCKNAVILEGLTKEPKRFRYTCTDPEVVVLLGWGHPDPPGNYAVNVTAPVSGAVSFVSDQGTRHAGCSPEWREEFDRFLAAYLAESRNELWIDLREYEFIT